MEANKTNAALTDAVKNATDILDNATKNMKEGSKDHSDVAIIFMSMLPSEKKEGDDKDSEGTAIAINIYGSERSAVELLARGMTHNKTLAFILKAAVHVQEMADRIAGAFGGLGGMLGIVLGGSGSKKRSAPTSLFEFLAEHMDRRGDKG